MTDAVYEIDQRGVETLSLRYTSNDRISYKVLRALAELHRRGKWVFEEIIRSSNHGQTHIAPVPGENKYLAIQKSTEIKIKIKIRRREP